MKGTFEYIDEDFNVRSVWDSNEIPATALEVVRFHVDKPEGMTPDEEAMFVLDVQVEFAQIRRMLHGEPEWARDYDEDDEEQR